MRQGKAQAMAVPLPCAATQAWRIWGAPFGRLAECASKGETVH